MWRWFPAKFIRGIALIRDWFSIKTREIGQFQFQSPYFYNIFLWKNLLLSLKTTIIDFFLKHRYLLHLLSTNIGLIYEGIYKTKCNIQKLDNLAAFSLMFLPEQWSSLQGKFWIKSLNLCQKIALHRGFALFSAIFNSRYTGDRTKWNRTNRGPPVSNTVKYNYYIIDVTSSNGLEVASST